MPDEVGTDATRSDAPGVGNSPFGDMGADDKPAEVIEYADSQGETVQDGQGAE